MRSDIHAYPEVEARLPALCQRISGDLPKSMGFALFIFDYGNIGRLAYASSADRDDVLNVLREWIAHESKGGGA